MTSPRRVAIHYRRLPDHLEVYDQRVVLRRDDVIITLSEPLELSEPLTADDEILLEDGSLALWFTFPGAWHDIGRFHRADGSLTGLYANVITPPVMEGPVWRTTDLFLDLWWPRDGEPRILDEDELEAALEAGHVDAGTAARARKEADRLLEEARREAWPPPVVEAWTLDRSLEVLDGA